MRTKNMYVTLALMALAVFFAAGCQSAHDQAAALHDKAEEAHDEMAASHDQAAGDHDAVAGDADHATPADPQVQAVLAHVDGIDGAEDKVLSQCAGCAAQMAGSEDHTLAVGEYTMHFCSADCRGRFEADPSAALLEVAENIPQPE